MRKPAVRMVGTIRRQRAVLLRTTALQATTCLVISLPGVATRPAMAQPAPSARPQGGQVVAGSASIAATASATTVNQASNRAAVNWTSFDVGSQQSVTFNQPSSSAITLNRVTGPDPSAIAGRVSANGQIIITNPSGVTFFRGAQVDAASVIVSAAGISNQNFMAGRLAFDQPAHPDARIDNRGTITVKQAGLAALVAPSVANSGVINAKLGQVVLAGAQTHTLDLYGDGLVSIDVTGQVRQAPAPGGKTVTALVTNTGLIQADGGVVQLTASAADGVVQTLVDAGGRIHANSAGGRAGRIEIAGTGGSVVVEGRVAADGHAPGSTGGVIVLRGDGATTLPSTAHVSASGRAGGGTIAIGTTLARATGSGAAPAGTSARTTVASGARVSADARGTGNGGRVTVLSTQNTDVAGTLTARGGKQGGNGGVVELSGETGFSLSGTVDTSAPQGALGTIVLDPTNLTIVANSGASTIAPPNGSSMVAYGQAPANATIREADVERLTGNIDLQATNNLTVNAPLTLTTQSLILEAGNTLTVNAAITAPNGITLNGGVGSFATPGGGINITVNGVARAITAGIALNAGSGGITISGVVDTGVSAMLTAATTGALVELGTGQIITRDLSGTASSVSLLTPTNQIYGVGSRSSGMSVTGAAGDFSLVTSVPLTVGSSTGGGLGVQTGRTISLVADSLTVQPPDLSGNFNGFAVYAPTGTIVVAPFTASLAVELTGGAKTANTLSLTNTELGYMRTGTLQLGQLTAGVGTAGAVTFGTDGSALDLGSLSYQNLVVYSNGAITQNAPLAVGQISGQAASVSLIDGSNFIPTLAGFTTTAGDFAFHTSGNLLVSGALTANAGAGSINLSSTGAEPGGAAMTLAADIKGGAVNFDSTNGPMVSTGGGIKQTAGTITAATLTGQGYFATLLDATNQVARLGTFTTYRGFGLTTAQALSITGTVTAGSIVLNAQGISQSATSALLAGQLDGTSTGDVTLDSRLNAITAMGSFATTAGSFTLVTSSPTLSLGSFGSGLVSSDTGSLTFEADRIVKMPTPGGGINAPAGTVTFAPFTPSRPIELIGGSVANPGALSINGTLTALVNAATLDLGLSSASPLNNASTGAINIGNAGETIALRPHAATLNLASTAAVTENATAVLDVATLTGATGSVTLTSANTVDRLGAYTVTPATAAGSFSLSSGPLTVAGPVSVGGLATITSRAALQIAGDITAGGVALQANGGDLTQSAGIIQTSGLAGLGTALGASGAVIQNGGSLIAGGPLSGSATSVLLPSTANDVQFILSYNTTGAFSLTDSRNLEVQAGLSAGGNLTLHTLAGGLKFDNAVSGQAATLTIAGAVTEGSAQGATFASLSGSAASISLDTASNKIGTLGTLNTSAGFSLLNGSTSFGMPLSVTGTVADNTAITIQNYGGVSVSGGLQAPVITVTAHNIEGPLAPGPNPDGTITQTGGSISGSSISLVADSGLVQSGGSITATGAGAQVALSTGGAMLLGGSVSAPAITLAATTETITGFSTTTVYPGTITQTVGTIAGTVSGHSDSTTSLQSANNAITTLGSFSSAGGFALTDAVPLSVTGSLTDATSVTLTTTALALGGVVTTPSLTIKASGAVTQPGGSLQVGALAGSAAGAGFGQRGNSVGTLSGFASTGDLSLTDAASVTIAGSNSAGTGNTLTLTDNTFTFATGGMLSAPGGTVSLQEYAAGNGVTLGAGSLSSNPPIAANTLLVGSLTGGPIAITGPFNLSQVAVLNLLSGGAITETGTGAVQVGTLTGSGASATLTGANAVTTLAGFTTTGLFNLVDQSGLTVSGPLSAGSAQLTANGPLTLAGNITAPTSLTLAMTSAGGAINQTAGTIATASLSGTSSGTASFGSATNAVTTLAGFGSTGGFTLADTGALSVTAPVTDNSRISLQTAGALTLASGLTAPLVNLVASNGVGGSIAQTGGIITAATLTGSASGTVDLSSAGNAVASIGSFSSSSVGSTTGNGFRLFDTGNLTVNGPLTVAGPASGNLSIVLQTTGSIVLAGAVNGATVGLTAGSGNTPGGSIGETAAGVLTAGMLTGSATSTASLSTATNSIADVRSFSSAGGFALTTAGPLTIDGPLTDATSVALTTAALSLAAQVTTGALTINASGAVTQPGGSLQVSTLSGNAVGAVFGQANSVGTLTGFTSSGDLTLRDAAALTIAGTNSAGTGRTLTIADDAPIFAAGGVLSAPGGTVALQEYTPGLGVTLGGNGLASNPPVVAATLAVGSLTGGPITIAGGFNLSQVGVLNLLSAGAVNETATGALRVATLTGNAATASLTGANAITTLGGFTTTGAFNLSNQQGLTVSGSLSAASAALSVDGSLTLAGTITAPSLTLNMTSAGGAINQTAGIITSSSLSGSSLGTARFTSAGNTITTLAGFSSVGGFALTDGGALSVTGALTDTASVALTTAALSLAGVVTTPALTINASGAVTQPGGSLQVGTLSGFAAGAVFGQQGNSVGTLNGFASSGDLSLTDAAALTVAGTNSAGAGRTLTLADDALTFATGVLLSAPGGTVALQEYTPGRGVTLGGNGLGSNPPVVAATLAVGSLTGGPITIAGGFNLSQVGVLDLLSAGAVTETATGALQVGTLAGNAASANLTGPNAITTLAGFTTTGAFNLSNQQDLTVSGPLSTGSATLTVDGFLTLAGNVTAPSLTLNMTSAGGAINQTAGVITTASLSGNSQGTASFTTAGNAITTLAGFTSAGGFALTDGGTLSVAGPLTDTTSVALTTGAVAAGGLSLAGVVTTPTLTISANGAVTQPGGSLQVGTLSGMATGAVFGQQGNSVGTLSGFASRGDLSLTDAAGLRVAGTNSAGAGRTLTLADDSLSFAGGVLSAPGGTVALQEYTPGRGITLGGTVLGSNPPVVAATLAVGSATGGPIAITQTFNLSQVGVLNLLSGGAITETGAGALQVATLAGSAASASLNGANRIGTLGGFTTPGGNFSLANVQGLTVSGPLAANTASLNVAGNLVLAGNVTGTTTLALNATGAIGQSAGLITTAGLSGQAASAALGNASNAIAVSQFVATTGDFQLSDGRSLTVNATSSPGTVALNVVGNLSLNAPETGQTVALTATGAISENSAGNIVAGTLTVAGDSARLLATSVTTLAGATTKTGFSLFDLLPLTVSGTVADGSAVTLQSNGALALAGSVSAPAVTIGGAGISQTGGTINATTLAGSSTGSTSLNATANAVTGLGAFSSTGDFALTDATPVSVTGTVAVGSGRSLTLADNSVVLTQAGQLSAPGGSVVLQAGSPGGGIALGGTTMLPAIGTATFTIGSATSGPVTITAPLNLSNAAVVNLQSGGAINETGTGALQAGTLTGNAASASLNGANTIATLGGFRTSGAFSLTNAQGLAVTGPLTATIASLTTAGDLTLAGSISAPTQLTLNANRGAITQTAGTIATGSLGGGGAATTLGGANSIGALAGFTTGTLTLNDTQTLGITGPVSAGATTLTAPGVTVAADFSAGSLTVTTGGSLIQTGGNLTVGTLSGTAGQAISLGTAGTASVASLSTLSAGTAVYLTDRTGLAINGNVSAPTLAVSANRSLTVNGGTITIDPASFQVTAGSDGAASFTQTGVTTFAATTAGTTPAVTISLPATGGTLTLANLVAPTTNLTLSTGSGTASGMLSAGSLLVLGQGGSANLSGSVQSLTGFAAAQASRIMPAVDQAYLLNGCAIASISCGVVTMTASQPTVTLFSFLVPQSINADVAAKSVLRPDILALDVLDLSVTRDRDDPTLQLPNISDRDY